MRCFIHMGTEAISVCKRCGKAMCADCSKYSGHSGVCPECRRDDFIRERSTLNADLSKNTKSVTLFTMGAVLAVILAVAVCILAKSVYGLIILVAALVCGIRLLMLFNKRKDLKSRIGYLTGEIDKLGLALEKGTSVI